MSALSPILRSAEGGRVGFWCPGCNEAHYIPVADQHSPGRNWGFNGNVSKPTFTPSILVRTGHYVTGRGPGDCYCTWDRKDQAEFADMKCSVCHSFVTDGRILFLSDCTHALAGQTVDIPKWPTGEGEP